MSRPSKPSTSSTSTDHGLQQALGTRDIFVAGVGLVVAATTLVSDFVGWFTVGSAFWMALLLAFGINLLLGLSAAELSTTYPKAGALYDYGAATLRGTKGILLGLFLANAFYVMFAFAGAGEITAGAIGLQAVFNAGGSVVPWILVMVVLAIVPNVLGVATFARVELWVLVAMLGLRWFFGLAGFAGLGDTGSWSASNWDAQVGVFDWSPLLSGGLALAFWSFVGIEFVAPLAEETRNARRAIPTGIVAGLVAILATSYVMGFGVGGTQSTAAWADTALGAAGCDGDCPQLAVGEAMFGGTGRGLMALATFLATFASLNVAFAAMPRILYGMARDGEFLGPLSRLFAYTHPRFRTPIVAIVATAAVHVVVAVVAGSVVSLILSAAYAWATLYIAYHVLVIVSRFTRPEVARPFALPLWVPALGVVGTIVSIGYAFAGAHGEFGVRSLFVFAVAAVLAGLSFGLRPPRAHTRTIDVTDSATAPPRVR